MANYGVAIDGITDTEKTWGLVGGLTNLGNSIARRLTTQEGSLFYDLGYGFDLRQLLNGPTTDQAKAEALGRIENQCVQDERIDSATATLINPRPDALQIKLVLVNSDASSFSLVLSITQLSVELLSVESVS